MKRENPRAARNWDGEPRIARPTIVTMEYRCWLCPPVGVFVGRRPAARPGDAPASQGIWVRDAGLVAVAALTYALFRLTARLANYR